MISSRPAVRRSLTEWTEDPEDYSQRPTDRHLRNRRVTSIRHRSSRYDELRHLSLFRDITVLVDFSRRILHRRELFLYHSTLSFRLFDALLRLTLKAILRRVLEKTESLYFIFKLNVSVNNGNLDCKALRLRAPLLLRALYPC